MSNTIDSVDSANVVTTGVSDAVTKSVMPLQKNSKLSFTESSLKILENRYLCKDSNGVATETLEDMFDRVARVVSEPDAPYADKEKTYIEFYNMLTTKKFFPNSPTFTGAGTPLGQLAACFVLPIADDLGKSRDGIFSTLNVAALIQQVGGGNGFSFSRLRPKNDVVKSSNGIATGPVGFMSVYDRAFGEIAQGGVRKGANMGVLRVDHPDIRDFIKCKATEGAINNFNISVALTDDFMKAVRENTTYDLVNPRTKQVVESPKAREIFDMLVEYSYLNGEPGVLFIDAANRSNPVSHLYDLEATNPCGEQWLGPYENCCLGSVNLAMHVVNGELDWEALAETIKLATRFLDNVITANKYVEAVPELREAAENARRIGLGFMGLSDVMYSLGIRYGSDKGQEFAAQVAEFLRYHTMKTSIELARERGTFKKIEGSIYDPKNLKWTRPIPLKPYMHDFKRPAVDWASIEADLRQYGIRNAAQTTIAPTGTISTVVGLEGYGCEPVFALAYYRNVYQAAGGAEKMTLTYVSPLFSEALEKSTLPADAKERIVNIILEKGTCQGIEELPDEIKDTFVVSADITPEEHIKTQASIQAFIDNSISKTCNFPATAKKDDVARVYMLGWELGCKGLTVYVTGSRKEVVLETKETKRGATLAATQDAIKPRLRMPKLFGYTYKLKTPQGNAFITVNSDDKGNPFEIFASVGKAGSDVTALSEALGRALSGWIRESSNPMLTVKEIIAQMIGIGGARATGFGKNRVSSVPDAIAKVLAEELHIKVTSNGTTLVEDDSDEISVSSYTNLCPECGNMSLLQSEGCSKCFECGYSVC